MVDARRGLGDFELEMLEIFDEQKEEVVILMNKVDKLNQKEKNKIEKEILEKIGEKNKVIFFSAKTGKGKDKFLELI